MRYVLLALEYGFYGAVSACALAFAHGFLRAVLDDFLKFWRSR